MWLTLAAIGYSLLAIVAILDKFVVSTERVKPLVFVFYSTIIALPVLLLVPVVGWPTTSAQWCAALLGGLAYAVALGTMYQGFSESEVSHIGPLVGAAVPFFTLIINRFFLHEPVTTGQMLAISFLIAGSLLISLEKGKQHVAWQRGAAWAVLAGFCFATFYTLAKYLYSSVGLYQGVVYLYGSMAVLGSLLLLFPAVRRHFKKKTRKQAKKSRGEVAIVVADKVLALVAVAVIQVAIALGSVTLVNAMSGLQYGVLVVLVAILSYFRPKLFREKYTHGEAAQELVAVILIGAGVALLVAV